MVDRQDLDALLISALYGELTPAEEARLQTHLDSHPTDRTALADLTLARNAVRESRIFQVQLDPPQAVSALLLQEAARRAPKLAKPADADREGWFQRFVRSFVAHPAMAAAAMMVLVLGVAGTLYLRGDNQFAEQTAQQERVGAAPTLAPPAEPQDETRTLQQHAGSAYEATLEEGRYDKNQSGEASGQGASPTPAPATGKDTTKESTADKGGAGIAGDVTRAPAVASPKRSSDTYLSTERQQFKPKDLESERRPAKKAETGTQPDTDMARARSADDSIKIAGKPFGGAANQPRTTDAPNAGIASATGSTAPAPPPPPVVATTRDGRVTADNKARANTAPTDEQRQESEEANLLSWAKDVHTRVVAQVRAGNCKDATALALTLSNRAPGYYAQNVENDRLVKNCMQYINAERERAADKAMRARAATKRAEEPAKAAPSPSSK
jgi:hypothetical protein